MKKSELKQKKHLFTPLDVTRKKVNPPFTRNEWTDVFSFTENKRMLLKCGNTF